MIVRLDFEDRCEAIADIHGAGVLTGPLQHLRTLCGERPQVHTRALVTAVLRPHHREDAEFGQIGLAPEEFHDALVLVALEAVAFDGRGIDVHAVANAFTMDSRMTSPSTQPSAGS